MTTSLLKVPNLREKQEVLLPHQSAGGVDLSHGTLTGMANMTRLVVEVVDICFCFLLFLLWGWQIWPGWCGQKSSCQNIWQRRKWTSLGKYDQVVKNDHPNTYDYWKKTKKIILSKQIEWNKKWSSCRWGVANIEERPGKVYLSFAILLQVSFIYISRSLLRCKLP